MTRDKVLRIQADKLAELLKLKPGTYLKKDMIRKVAEAKCGEIVVVNGVEVIVLPSAIGLANVILNKV